MLWNEKATAGGPREPPEWALPHVQLWAGRVSQWGRGRMVLARAL